MVFSAILLRELESQRIIKKFKKINLKARRPRKGEETEYKEFYYKGILIEIPDDVPLEGVNISGNISTDELTAFIDSIQQPEKNFIENELPDHIIDSDNYPTYTQGWQGGLEPKFPEGWEKAYYPAGKHGLKGKKHGKKPNISKIKTWVENTKLGSKSQLALETEYMRVFNVGSINNWSENHKERLIDSIAFMVARKIWYVGRRSSRETDEYWDNHTRDMRPPQGSFSRNEEMNMNFPYDSSYEYRSGDKGYT
jgi:hypothetical protein